MTIKDKNGKILAISYTKEGTRTANINFLTEKNLPFQVGTIETRKEDREVLPHKHNDFDYGVKTTSEFIYLESGKVIASIYDDDFNLIKTIKMLSGDFILLLSGGHSFKIKKNSRLIEIKQGAYQGDEKSKVYK